MNARLILATLAIVLQVSGAAAAAPPPAAQAFKAGPMGFAWQAIPHTKVFMLVPDGWTVEYDQGTTTLASGSRSRYYSPTELFAGALVQVFVSDAPRAIGPSFDVLQLAQDFIALQATVTHRPALHAANGRQIVTAQYAGRDTKGQPITYLAAFVLENQVLTVFLAATPEATEASYVPVLEQMVASIVLKQPVSALA
jgi:hypothetical protein